VQNAALQDSNPQEIIRIAKIRIFIDAAEYEWTEGGIEEIEAGTNRRVLKKETIVSFLSFRPGQRLSLSRLESRCADTERRLLDSGYVYQASVTVVPPRRNPEERTLVVELLSGYLWRFNGGNAWAMAGKAGLGGERAVFRAYGGYNRNGIEYKHSRVGGIPLVLGGQFYYYGPGSYYGKDFTDAENRFEAAATAGWYLSPDFFVGLDLVEGGFGFSSQGLFSLQPNLSFFKYLRWGYNSNAGFNLRFHIYPLLEISKYESTFYFHWGISPKWTFALKGSGEYSRDLLPESEQFDLYLRNDRNVRSGYSAEELRGTAFALGAAELRYNFFHFNAAAVINCTLQGFVFTDLGSVFGGSEGNSFVDAYGGGIRVLFNNPMFAYFTFAYGVNHEGNGRFTFTGTAGF
jgi:hypothetical protein